MANEQKGAGAGIGAIGIAAVAMLRVCAMAGSSTHHYTPPYNYDSKQFLQGLQPLPDVKGLLQNTDVSAEVAANDGTISATLDTGSRRVMVKNISSSKYVAHAEISVACSDYKHENIEVSRLAPGEVQGVRVDCSRFATLQIGRVLTYTMGEDGAFQAASAILNGGYSEQDLGDLVYLVCLEYRPEYDWALLQAASQDHMLEPTQNLGPFLRGSLRLLADRQSDASLWVDARHATAPLLERLPSWDEEKRRLGHARVGKVLDVTFHEDERRLLRHARVHDATSTDEGHFQAVAHVAEALGREPSPESADALIYFLLHAEADAKELDAVGNALARMPEQARAAYAKALASPSGDERRLRQLPRAAALSEGVLPGAFPRFEVAARTHVARRVQEIRAMPAAEQLTPALALGRFAGDIANERMQLDLPTQDALQRLLVDLAQSHRAAKGYEDALKLLRAARAADVHAEPARLAYAELQRELIGRWMEPGFYYDGPGPEFDRTEAETRESSLDELVTDELRCSNEHGCWPTDPAVAALARLDAARLSAGPMPGDAWLRFKLTALAHRTDAIVTLLLLAFVFLVYLVRWPERLGLFFARRGFGRFAPWLIRSRSRKTLLSPKQIFNCARGFMLLAEKKLADADAMRAEVREMLDRTEADVGAEALRGRLDAICGDEEIAEAHYRKALGTGTDDSTSWEKVYRPLGDERELPAWLREAMHLDLARFSFRRRNDSAAALHARKAGSGGVLLAAAAALRAGQPDVRGLWWRTRFGAKRFEAAVLLTHGLIDLKRFAQAHRLAVRLPDEGGQRGYALARLAEAQGELAQALSLYGAVREQHPQHAGARLSLALLEPEPHRTRALETLAGEVGDAGKAAREALNADDLKRGDPARVFARLGGQPKDCGSWREARQLGAACAAMNRYDDAVQAFAAAAALNEPEPVADRGEALALRALQANDPSVVRALVERRMKTSLLARELDDRARWTMVLKRFKASVDQGLTGAAVEMLGKLPPSEPDCAGISTRYCRVLTLLSQGRLEDARTEMSVAPRHEPLWEALRLVVKDESTEPQTVRDAFARARTAHPSLDAALGIVEASFFVGRGHFDLAREVAKGVKLPDDKGDPKALGLALLAAPLGIESGAGSGLSRVLELVRSERFAEAAAALDALGGHAFRDLRLGLAARAALVSLHQRDVPAALAQLTAALDVPVDDRGRALKSRRHLEHTLMLLEPKEWTVAAMEEPTFALTVLEPQDLHDRAVLHVAGLAASPTTVALYETVVALDALASSRATLARHRLRALELQGASPAPRIPFEDQALEQLRNLLAGLLRAFAEHAPLPALAESLRAFEDVEDESFIARAREQVITWLDEDLRAALERAERNSETSTANGGADQIFSELDGTVRRQLERLKAVGAPSGVVNGMVDAAARCFDELSITFHRAGGCSRAALKSVERALELERADHVRERLMRNRRVMAG
jgi:tetratricopeptide (TPR) repeat protein